MSTYVFEVQIETQAQVLLGDTVVFTMPWDERLPGDEDKVMGIFAERLAKTINMAGGL